MQANVGIAMGSEADIAIRAGQFVGYSAGSHPTGKVNSWALELLRRMNFSTEGYRSKDWTEFSAAGAPHMDFVFTLCDRAAGEGLPGVAGPADDRALGRG